jgi:hypothetical protein
MRGKGENGMTGRTLSAFLLPALAVALLSPLGWAETVGYTAALPTTLSERPER